MLREFIFSQEPELFTAQNLTGEGEVIDGERDRRLAAGSEHERIGEPDVQFGTQQIQAEPFKRVPFGEFDHEQAHLGERMLVLREQELGVARFARDHADDGVVAGVVYAEGADGDAGLVELADQFVEFPDPVVEEDAELRDARRSVPLIGFQTG